MIQILEAITFGLEADEVLHEDTVEISPLVRSRKQALYVWADGGEYNAAVSPVDDVAPTLMDVAYSATHPATDYPGFLRRVNNLIVWLQGRTFATDANGIHMNPSWRFGLEMAHDESIYVATIRMRYAVELWWLDTEYPDPSAHPLNLPDDFQYPATIIPVVEPHIDTETL